MGETRPSDIGLKYYGSKKATLRHYRTRFLLALLGGFFGAHKFYDGKRGMGVVYLLTLGIFGIGWLVDAVGAGVDLFKIERLYADKQTVREQPSKRQGKQKRSAKRPKKTQDYDEMDGAEFERFVARLLKDNGFTNVEITELSADHGVDILAKKDGKTYAIQCKRYASNVGNEAVQEVFTAKAIYGCDKAVVVTNSHFTKQAMEDARKIGVELWDREKLDKLIER